MLEEETGWSLFRGTLAVWHCLSEFNSYINICNSNHIDIQCHKYMLHVCVQIRWVWWSCAEWQRKKRQLGQQYVKLVVLRNHETCFGSISMYSPFTTGSRSQQYVNPLNYLSLFHPMKGHPLIYTHQYMFILSSPFSPHLCISRCIFFTVSVYVSLVLLSLV